MLILGVDYGEQRVGFAISDPTGSFAMPTCMKKVNSEKEIIREIISVSREKNAEKIVIGLPLNMNGSKGPMANKVEQIAEKLRSLLKIPIELWDERLTTKTAEKVLIEADMSRKKRKQVRDKLAAQVILQTYLDSQQSENYE